MSMIRTGDIVIMVGDCAIYNRIYSPVICIILRFEVCANFSLQTHEFSADYSESHMKIENRTAQFWKVLLH